jgi:hypothetical protein
VSGTRSPFALAAAALVLLVVSSCGPTTRVGASRTLGLGLEEYRVLPQDVHADSGPLTIVVHNYGRLTHSLVIYLNGLAEASTPPIPPGQTAVLYTLLSPGNYQTSSNILSDQALGAYGTLDVTGSIKPLAPTARLTSTPPALQGRACAARACGRRR